MRTAILYGAAMASGALDGILTYGISHMKDIGGLKPWQWTFLLEGSPIIPLGIITYLFLDNIPNAVQWLNNMEKQLLTNLLRNDAGVADSESTSGTRFSWLQVRYVFIDWRIYFYGLINIGNATVLIYREVDKPAYRRGHLICAGMTAGSLILTIILRICLMRENHRRKNLSPEEYAREAAVKEPCDWVS
ncbi:unnamed protein product [Rotaria sp. Silwood1]|nr:unnamed protein product [Rotaria sp. Silwood1]CAF1618479.1 unnamed protein product [Rotaria sp. Silwood1]CAF3696094.1 unnamed protein product [Rotaria sp. Silwood1]CAF3734577.1 unnamed protein product [Rotaria sp. Silwood1]CAF3759014.1 unnamed protein product [Rotaria sp. Silwood1]